MHAEVKGLVLRTVDLKESDRLLTIYTEEQGIVTALAKGARSLKSRKMSSTMQFCYSSFVLYKQGEHYQVRECELIESFFGLHRSIEGLALATYITEVVSDVAVAQPETELLRLALNSLYAISEHKCELGIIKAAFEIRTASIIGFMPEVLSCSACGEKSGDFYFEIMSGAIKCRGCREKMALTNPEPEYPHEAQAVCLLSEGAKTALGYCIYSPLKKIFSFRFSDSDMTLFSRACEEYLLNHLERSFNSLDFYKEVAR